ncbi:ATP-binding protein [Bifidobacterium panos]|uniref:ATPase AAA n=1 Tax=Bifidobacterium panos TaxID=2675321 RepID=A0ABX1SZB7_9BIFI|nr:ATP-binding protein [Bifidobacterium sp. DSM 109963]NMN02492.1 ATPase AAA [Bifidobacterium sp. DSM 109963]
MLRRKAMNQLEAWHASSSRTALLVTGARQVGKTYLVREFAHRHYANFVELNFIEQPDLAQAFEGQRDVQNMIMRLELAAGHPLVPGETLVFLDEIQACKEAATAIKFLVDDGRFDFVMSGSLLGVELEDIRSVPVGYQSEVPMFPLDFEEFCWSRDVGEDVFAMLRECLAKREPVDAFVHEKMMDLFRQYLVIGGMPAVVASFQQSGSILDVRTMQEDIKRAYRRDISQYAAKADRLHIKTIYDLVPSELNNPNKRFTFAKVGKGARFKAMAGDFDWLAAANVALPAYNVDEPRKPLEMSKERNLFKLFYSDVGLLTGAYLNSTALNILSGDDNVNYGGIYENVVAQELAAHGFQSLYYYNSKRLGELDFLIQDRNDRVIPIEVKSGKNYKVHRALNNVLAEPNFHIEEGLVLGPGNVEIAGKVTYLPIYMVGLLENQ